MMSQVKVLKYPKFQPIMVNDHKNLEKILKSLIDTTYISIDTERASGYTYQAYPQLIQIKIGDITMLIDPIHDTKISVLLRTYLKDKCWIIHAAEQDLISLDIVNIRTKSIFDTELAGRFLGLDFVNLSFMTEILLSLKLEKGFAQSRWHSRPFSDDMLNYAALDVELLNDLKIVLEEKLILDNKFSYFQEECRYICEKSITNIDPEKWRKTKGINHLKSRTELMRLFCLWSVREDIAKTLDIFPKLLIDDLELVIAAKNNILNPKIFENFDLYNDALKYANSVPTDKLIYKASGRKSKLSPESSKRRTAIRECIEELALNQQYDKQILLNSKIITEISESKFLASKDIYELGLDIGARNWQMELLSNPISAALGANS